MKTLLVLTLLVTLTLQADDPFVINFPELFPAGQGTTGGSSIVFPDFSKPLNIAPPAPPSTGQFTPGPAPPSNSQFTPASAASDRASNHNEIVKQRTSNSDWNVLGYSGDGISTKVLYSGTPQNLPRDLQLSSPAKTRGSASQQTLREVSVNPFPWLPSAQLVTPGPTTIIMNTGLIVIYQITFYNDCPTNQVWMHLHVWDQFILWDPVTHQQIYPSSGWANPICHLIKIPPKCGCNKLWLVLYNWQNPSFYSFWYDLYQSQTGCYDCRENPNNGFYNRLTCKCQCSFECQCSTFNKIWAGYPTCGCKCKEIYKCITLKYFNTKTCTCECKPICCPTGTAQSPETCLCVKKNPFITANDVAIP